MTDNEIIKALNYCCGNDEECNEDMCYQVNLPESRDEGTRFCRQWLIKDALDLITRQKAEIERLQKNIDGLNIFTKNHIKVIRLQTIKEFAEEFKYFVLNEDIEVVEPKCKDYESYINGANQFRHQIKNGINNLVKEMTE